VSQPTIHELYRALIRGQLSRRDFVAKAAAIGISAPAVAFFLKAASVRAQEEPTPVPADVKGTGVSSLARPSPS
jgi:hypothetical protein